jgi:predicted nucleic-acid-binding protein
LRYIVGIDANILVRFLTADDKHQYQLALDYIRKQVEIFVTKTVMLELEWVLRAGYKIPKSQLAGILSDLIEME